MLNNKKAGEETLLPFLHLFFYLFQYLFYRIEADMFSNNHTLNSAVNLAKSQGIGIS